MERNFQETLLPVREALAHSQGTKKFSLKRLAGRRGKFGPYEVPFPLGVILNSIKKLLEVLRPRVEGGLRGWVENGGRDDGNRDEEALGKFGEKWGEVTVEIRANYRNTLQGIVEKLCENVSF